MLMPQQSIRWCKPCGRSYGTAYPYAMDCPYCTLPMPDVSHNWPHVCARSHSSTSGGECPQCAKECK